MRVLSFIVAAYLAAISIPAVVATAHAASGTSFYTNEARWEVSVDDKGECSMSKTFDQGTFFMIGYLKKQQGFWFGFGRNDWAPLIVQNKNYTIDARTDNKEWRGEFHGNINGNHGAFLSNDTMTKEFISALARSTTIWFINPETGKWFRRLSLEGSYDGLVQLFACQQQHGWTGGERNVSTYRE